MARCLIFRVVKPPRSPRGVARNLNWCICMPTAIGVVFFCCGAYCFLRKEEGLLGLLIIAIAFEASSAVNIADRGIQPYYVVALWIILRAFANRALGIRSDASMPQGRSLLLFGAIAIASGLVYPIVFAGIPVYEPKIGIDDGLFIRPPLKLGLNNLAQAGFLACHICVLYAILSLRVCAKKARSAYVVTFYIVAAVVFVQSLCQIFGIAFPYKLLLSNPGQSVWDASGNAAGTRNPGTFSEPSLVGGFMVLYCMGFIAEYLSGKGRASRVLVALAATGAIASSGSLFILLLFIILLAIRYSPFRFPWYLSMRRSKRIGWILLLLVMPAILVLAVSPSYRETLALETMSKSDSGSFVNRSAADLYALQLLAQTHGAGVGIGSNRASSMLASLFSTVGIAGVLAFGMFYVRLFTSLSDEDAWLRWAAFALLANMCLDISDVTMPMLWLPALLAIAFRTERKVFARPSNRERLTTATNVTYLA
jgi:hypothetical protein